MALKCIKEMAQSMMNNEGMSPKILAKFGCVKTDIKSEISIGKAHIPDTLICKTFYKRFNELTINKPESKEQDFGNKKRTLEVESEEEQEELVSFQANTNNNHDNGLGFMSDSINNNDDIHKNILYPQNFSSMFNVKETSHRPILVLYIFFVCNKFLEI